MANKLYIGRTKEGAYVRFRSPETPTHATHGSKFSCVIGPFRTVAGAEFMRCFGHNNPHCRTVAEAEKLSKLHGFKQ